MSSSKRSRRHFTTEQKVAILKRHMVDKVPVSDLCDELGLQTSVFYQWQRQVLENLAGTFSTPTDDGPSKREKDLVAKTKELEAKLAKKDNVIAEVTAELVKTKQKILGSSDRPLGSPRHPRHDRRLRARVVRQDRDRRRPLRRVDRHGARQVLRLEEALRQGERAQRPRATRPLAPRRGEAQDHRLPRAIPSRGLPPADVHDDRSRGRCCQPVERLPSARRRRPCSTGGTRSHPRRARASCSRSVPTSIGTSTSRT